MSDAYFLNSLLCLHLCLCLCLSISLYSPIILPKLQSVLEQYLSLQDRAERQITALQEQSQLHQFERETQLVDAWLLSKQNMAESDNYGQDLENVEVKQMLSLEYLNYTVL